jgi:PAS domain S-box-containing protein
LNRAGCAESRNPVLDQTTSAAPATRLGNHFVQFYRDDRLLLDEVADFIDGALRAGDVGVVIASAGRQADLQQRLQAGRLAVGASLWYPGELVFLDASTMLDAFMVEGWPDEQRFADTIGALIERVSNRGTRGVRAFGEMVAILCAQGNHAAAIRLEELWNKLGHRQSFSLFCAYPLDLFTRPEYGKAFEHVCHGHTHVLPVGRGLADAADARHDMTLAELQQKTATLELEIAKRTQAEQTLRRRERELADFVENAAEGLNRVGPDGTILWANRAELEMLGYAADDYVGQPVAGFHVDPLRGGDIADRLSRGDTLYNEPAALRCRDGTVRHVLIHSSPVLDSGVLTCNRCFTRDVTERELAREVLEKAGTERARLTQSLESANRAKDEFLAMLGHELRNPLAPIVTALQLMKMRGDTETAKEQGIIQRQVDHLIRLVDDLLDVSKITRGKIELRTEAVDLGQVLARAVEMASLLLEQRRHRLIVHAPSRGLRWVGDPVRLAQVVANLLTNAARYTPSGGEVRLTAFRDTHDVVISVQDNGNGIPPHMLGRVFELFAQGERGVDRAEGGLGIGLALVKSLVAMHGGSVVAKSEGLGQGSEFVVRLPLMPESASRTDGVLLQRPAAGVARGQRVLVVDDNADAADMLGLALKSQGHEVVVAHDPVAALKAVDGFAPDVAVLDIGLPAMDGYELAGHLRARMGTRPCRLIALTGYGQERDKLRSRDAGFAVHLVKPVDVDGLLSLIADGKRAHAD